MAPFAAVEEVTNVLFSPVVLEKVREETFNPPGPLMKLPGF